MEKEAWEGAYLVITSYGVPLTPVTSFKYLGRFLSAADDNWTLVVNSLYIVRQKWERLTKVLNRYGAGARTSVQIYLVVVQSFMIYESYTWVMTPHIGRVWGRFHHKVDCRLTGGNLRENSMEYVSIPLWRT